MKAIYIQSLLFLIVISNAVATTKKAGGKAQDARVYNYDNMIYDGNWKYFQVVNNTLYDIPANNGLDQAKDLWKNVVNDVVAIKATCYYKYAVLEIKRKNGTIWKERLPRLNLTTFAIQKPKVIDLEVKTNEHCILMFSDGRYAVSIANFN